MKNSRTRKSFSVFTSAAIRSTRMRMFCGEKLSIDCLVRRTGRSRAIQDCRSDCAGREKVHPKRGQTFCGCLDRRPDRHAGSRGVERGLPESLGALAGGTRSRDKRNAWINATKSFAPRRWKSDRFRLEKPMEPTENREIRSGNPRCSLQFSPATTGDELREVREILVSSPGRRRVQLLFDRANGNSLRLDAGVEFSVNLTRELEEKLSRWLVTAKP